MKAIFSFLTELSKSQTVSTGLYLAFLVIIGAFFEAYSSRIADTKEFSCWGFTDKYHTVYCLKEYNRGPNGLHKWLYVTSTYVPLGVLIFGMLASSLKVSKVKMATSSKCRFHIHYVLFVRIIVSLLVHLALAIVLIIYIWIVDVHVLDSSGTYACLVGNSTLHCVDGKAEWRVHLNITCCSIHIFFTLYNLTEVIFYSYKWIRAKEKIQKYSDENNGCAKCGYFMKKFNSYTSMLSLISIFPVLYFCFFMLSLTLL